MQCHQLNLQTHFGGGEVYTAFLCRALDALGVETALYRHPAASFWQDLGLPTTTKQIGINEATMLADRLPTSKQWILGHGVLPPLLRQSLSGHLKTAIAHMPVQGRNPRDFAEHDKIFAVSGWVRDGLVAASLPAWPEPLYGVARVDGDVAAEVDILRHSRYDWDRRKVRDRLLGAIEPAVEACRHHPRFARKPGLTLGIVSRLTPIKQFPLMFSTLAPVLARFPSVNLEIFGSGGYASVRDLGRALKPCAGQVRFWGQQKDVASVYRHIDYLMTGLPEKEALGLNVIEAMACGTPVLAVNAPPFTETVTDRRTGYLFTDPRLDGGEDFSRLLTQLEEQPILKPESSLLSRFGEQAFRERVRAVADWAHAQLASAASDR